MTFKSPATCSSSTQINSLEQQKGFLGTGSKNHLQTPTSDERSISSCVPSISRRAGVVFLGFLLSFMGSLTFYRIPSLPRPGTVCSPAPASLLPLIPLFPALITFGKSILGTLSATGTGVPWPWRQREGSG